MQEDIYIQMERVENHHWWFKARRDIILKLLKKYRRLEHDQVILDLGCGVGTMLKALQSYPVEATGKDFSEISIGICRKNGLNASFGKLPADLNAAKQVDTVLLLDVLEHIEDDTRTLSEIFKVVKNDGLLFLTVPAHPILWSEHDELHHHKRRYSKQQLIELANQSGWDIEFLSPYNSLLFPVSLVIRLFKKIFKISLDETVPPSNLINMILYNIFKLEGKWLLKDFSFPFGLSYVAVLKK